MKKLIATTVMCAVLVAPGVAYAWDQVDQGRGWRQARASGWTRDYRTVRFYAGHDQGIAGSFDVAWGVDCAGGFQLARTATVHDSLNHYWTRNIRIPSGEGRCDEAIAVRARAPRNVRMTAGIEAR